MKKLIFISVFAVYMFGCGTVKKNWLKENYVEKSELQQTEQRLVESTDEKIETATDSLSTSFKETYSTKSESTTTTENESTTVSGTIEAEDGKEKSVTIGDTTIKSNGATVSFETTSSKSALREMESRYSELESQFKSQQKQTSELQQNYNLLDTKFTELKSQFESEKNLKSKETKRSRWWFILIPVLAIGFIVYKLKS